MQLIHSIPALFFGKASQGRDARKRRHERHGIWLVAELMLPERKITLDGAVLEISRSGILYREATRHILDRRGTEISILLGDKVRHGQILNVSPAGYGILLDALIDEDELTAILASSLRHRAKETPGSIDTRGRPKL